MPAIDIKLQAKEKAKNQFVFKSLTQSTTFNNVPKLSIAKNLNDNKIEKIFAINGLKMAN